MNFRKTYPLVGVLPILALLTNALPGCSSEKGSGLYASYSANTPGGGGSDSPSGGVRSQVFGGSGGAVSSIGVGSMPSGGRPGSVTPLGTVAGAENTGGFDDGAGGNAGSDTGSVGRVSGGASAVGVPPSSGGMASSAGGSSAGGSSAGGSRPGGGSLGGATAAGGAQVACLAVGAERCDGRDENCALGITDENCAEDCVGIAHGAHGYMFCATGATRAEANSACGKAGLSLATIESADENAWVRKTATSQGIAALWLGGRDTAMEGVWRWVDQTQFWMGDASGTKVNARYANWQSEQPNNDGGNQNCVRLGTDGLWDDVVCGGTLSGFVCRAD